MSNLGRLREALRDNAIDVALLTHFGRVAWASGYAAFIEKGADPFAGGPPVALVSADDSALVLSYAPDVNQLQRELTYVAYDYQGPVDASSNWRNAVGEALGQMGASAGVIGYDADSTPAQVLDAARSRFPRVRLVDLGPVVDRLRALKTQDELARLREACTLCDVGQRAAREAAQPGKSEIQVYSAIHAALEASVSVRVPLGVDVISGERTLDMGGNPTRRTLQAGDLLMTDIHPRHPNGYWGDSCASFVVGGEASAEQREVQSHLWEAMQRGRDMLKPGIKASQIDAVVRGHVKSYGFDYPHHSGHGIGVTHFEQPLIMPWNDQALAEDMVLALEPGIYQPSSGGIRLEWVFRVTPSGGEPLTDFSLDI